MEKIVVISGAGISAESGIKTFRDSDGLWENHDVMDVASIEGWYRNPALVLDFYNQRRKQLFEVFPNEAHRVIANLEHKFIVNVVTQNVDDLHERAGSSKVLHLHGELRKVKSVNGKYTNIPWEKDLTLLDKDADGNPMRPDIVWFGEEVPKFPEASKLVSEADIVILVGTSLQVYPAASLIEYANRNAKVFYIDPNPVNRFLNKSNFQTIAEIASVGMKIVENQL